MAYEDNEVSVRAGKPRELYRFVGTYSVYRYTSASKPIMYKAPDEDEAFEYLPITLHRGDVNAGTPDDDNLDLAIELPVATEVVTAYAFNTSPPDLNVTIFRYHTLDDVRIYWRGRITNIGIEEGIATFTSPSELGVAMSQDFPNVYYQASCNHVLYDARCKVPEADWTVPTAVTHIEGKAITVASIGGLDGALIGGELALLSGERRMIVGQQDNQLLVNFPFSKLAVDDGVIIAAGCNYAYEGDCATKFHNQLNFGGFPFIPTGNIFADGIEEGSMLPDETCLPVRPCEGMIMNFRCEPAGVVGRLFSSNWKFPQFQPNPPSGAILSESNHNGPNWTIDEYDHPEIQEDLIGQNLMELKGDGYSFNMFIKYNIPHGDWKLQIQYPQGTWSSLGIDDAEFVVLKQRCYEKGPTEIFRAPIGGLFPYYFEWSE
jgi:hypothetical protein